MGMMGMGGARMGGMGMGRGMMGALPNGAACDVLAVTVGRTATAQPVLGPLPALAARYEAATPARPFVLAMQRMMTWTINGRVYEMTGVAEDEKVNRGEVTAWEWVNNSPIPHPLHIHCVQFQVVQRTPPATGSYATVSQGLVDSGWKDTVMVWPGERVKIAMQFGPYTGMYMYHCHILEHEDMTMMRNLMVAGAGMPDM
jgi:FtsP/CotA-like multicopper oxidase with cupredoxin domain